MALASTLPTGSLADCGAKVSTACACSAGSPRIMSTTRRAFRGVTRTYRAFALASIGPASLSCACQRASGVSVCRAVGMRRRPPLATAPPVVLDVAAERAGRRELAELVTDHRLGDEHRHVLAAVVHGNRVAKHGRNDHRTARPRLDDILGALAVLDFHLLDQVVVHKRALLKATRHCLVLLPLSVSRHQARLSRHCSLVLPLLLAAPSGDQLVARLVRAPGAPLGPAPRADRVPTAGGLALAAAHRVVDRVHGDAADARPAALPPAAAGLAE